MDTNPDYRVDDVYVGTIAEAIYRQAFRAYDRNGDISLLVHLICNAEIDSVKRIESLKCSYEKSRTINTERGS